MILHLFPLIFWAILATLIITPIAIKAAVRFQLIDEPNSSPHKIHQRPVPKAGGLAIGLVIISINFMSGNLQSGTIHTILNEKEAAIADYTQAVDLMAMYPKRRDLYQKKLDALQKPEP